MDQHVAAAAEIAGTRIGHRQREAGGDRGVDRVAALAQDVEADAAARVSCATTMPWCAGAGSAPRPVRMRWSRR